MTVTKRPWEENWRRIGTWPQAVESDAGRYVGTLSSSADAAMVEAAPELYRALDGVLGAKGDEAEANAAAKAALRKARGE